MIFNRRIVFLLLLSLPFPLAAQSTYSDSLDIVLKEKPDSIQLEILIDLFNTNSAQNYARARTTGYKALPLMRRLGSASRLAEFLMRIGQTEYTYGNHQQALQHYLESAGIYKKLKMPANEASLYNEIAVLHRKNKNIAESKEYIKTALSLYNVAYDTSGMATTLNNLGITFEIEGKTEEALNYYRQALTLYAATTCDLCISYSFDYIAGAFKILHQFDSAFFYENKSLVLRRKLNNHYAIAQSLMTLGEIYFEQGNYGDAIGYFKESAALCRSINFKDFERSGYEYLSKCYERTGDFKHAYQYQTAFTQIHDSIFNETRSKQISELQIFYETEKKEGQIRSLQQDRKNRNYILVATLGFLGMLSAIGTLSYRKQRLKNALAQERAIKQTEETERLRIAKDIHDDLGSGLSKIHFLSQQLFYKRTEDDIKKNVNAVMEISGSLIENMRDLVWELNTDNTTLDNLIARIREHSTDYLEDSSVAITSRYPDTIPDLPLGKLVYRNIFLTVKEAFHNIVKHSKASQVKIAVDLRDQQLYISIHDNGIGFKSDITPLGNGLLNMKGRIASIGGTFRICGETSGTQVELSFSLNPINSQLLL